MLQAKHDSYYRHPRTLLYEFLSGNVRRTFPRVLNVGCAGGADAPVLRGFGASYIVGIEPVAKAAAQAATVYDHVSTQTFEAWRPMPGEAFDLIIFADVLEHLLDPVRALGRAKEWLAPGGLVLISVPNVRHVSVLLQLGLRGDWRYEREGILDETHLHFYTLKSLRRMLKAVGLRELSSRHAGLAPLLGLDRALPSLAGLVRSQVYCIACPVPSVSSY